MSLWSMIKGHRGATGFGYASTAEQVTAGRDLSGKTYLVTGMTSGLGLETARVLAKRGALVVAAARTEAKASAALAEVGAEGLPVACDLSEPAQVRAAVERVLAEGVRLDGVIANAGIMALPELNQKYGYELQFLTNHVGHFILVTGLLGALADDGRVVVLSSEAHKMTYRGGLQLDNLSGERGYQGWQAYGQSKLANVLFARELARRLKGTGKTANAVHPGVINTNLTRHMSPVIQTLTATVANAVALKSVEQGAATQCYVAAHPDAARISGEYWADCNVAKTTRYGRDMALAARLWEVTEEIVAEL